MLSAPTNTFPRCAHLFSPAALPETIWLFVAEAPCYVELSSLLSASGFHSGIRSRRLWQRLMRNHWATPFRAAAHRRLPVCSAPALNPSRRISLRDPLPTESPFRFLPAPPACSPTSLSATAQAEGTVGSASDAQVARVSVRIGELEHQSSYLTGRHEVVPGVLIRITAAIDRLARDAEHQSTDEAQPSN